MNWTKATDEQLFVIVKHDNSCPRSLLSEAVKEMIDRGLFDRWIASCIHKTINNVSKLSEVYHLDFDDLMQIGRIEVLSATKRYKGDKGRTLTSFLYMCISGEILNAITVLKSQKRDSSKNISIDKENDKGLSYVLPATINVEKYVIDKMMLEQMIEKLTEQQKKIVFYRVQGYTFKEISELLPIGNNRTIHKHYQTALEKMRKGA